MITSSFVSKLESSWIYLTNITTNSKLESSTRSSKICSCSTKNITIPVSTTTISNIDSFYLTTIYWTRKCSSSSISTNKWNIVIETIRIWSTFVCSFSFNTNNLETTLSVSSISSSYKNTRERTCWIIYTSRSNRSCKWFNCNIKCTINTRSTNNRNIIESSCIIVLTTVINSNKCSR